MPNIVQFTDRNSDRWPSPAIWADFPEEALELPGMAIHLFDDFDRFPVPTTNTSPTEIGWGYNGFLADGATFTAADEIGGVVTMLAGNADNEAASFGQTQKPFQISRSHYDLWFECRCKVSTITDSLMGAFIGLIDAATLGNAVPIVDAGTLADENFVGFHRLEGDGDQFDTVYKANSVTQVTVATDAVTIAADTYVKLGMKYNSRTYELSFYADGVKLDDTYTVVAAAGTDFPNDVRMGLVFAVKAANSSPSTLSIDWVRCAQLLYAT